MPLLSIVALGYQRILLGVMLSTLRKGAANVLVKLLLLVVILSFIIWGVGDMIRASGNQDVASVGSHNITPDELMRALQKEIGKITQVTGKKPSKEQIQSFGIPTMVLNELISQQLLELAQADLGLSVSTAHLIDLVRNDSSFQNEKRQFDRHKFAAFLDMRHMDEKEFFKSTKKSINTDLFLDALNSASLPVQPLVARYITRYRFETRVADIITLPASAIDIGSIPEPDNATLSQYHQRHKEIFTVPEFRNIQYIYVPISDIQKTIRVSEQDLQQAYKERSSEFTTSEKRHIDQAIFDSEAQAKQAWDQLQQGKEFYATIKQITGLSLAEVNLGEVSKSDLLEGLDTEVFKLKINEYTKPLKSPFGFVIYRVNAISSGATPPLQAVKVQLHADLLKEKAEEELTSLEEQLDDAFASGLRMDEVAKQFKLTIHRVEAINAEGKSLSGSAISDLPKDNAFLATAFQTESNQISPVTPTQANDGFFVINVASITPPRIRSLDEVRGLATTSWKAEKRMELLKAKAEALSKKISLATDYTALLTPEFKLTINQRFMRSSDALPGQAITLPSSLHTNLFTLKPGQAAFGLSQDKTQYLIVKLHHVEPVSEASLEASIGLIDDELNQRSRSDTSEAYSRYLHKRYNVTINQPVLQQIINATSN